MATVAALFTSPARKSGVSTSHERVRAVAGHGFEGCAHANLTEQFRHLRVKRDPLRDEPLRLLSARDLIRSQLSLFQPRRFAAKTTSSPPS